MMQGFDFPIAYLWLAVGAFFLALEAFGASGVGLLFAGMAAMLVGVLLSIDLIALTDLTLQFAIWFGLTGAFALILWKPMRRWQSPKNPEEGYRNMVGDLATVEGHDLVRGSTGRARWSGTIMTAEIDPIADAVRIAAGEEAEITQVRGTTLYLRPRGSRRMEEVL